MRCPNCGGLNPDNATWCGQCFARFDGRRVEGAPAKEISEIEEAFAALAPSEFEISEGSPLSEALEGPQPSAAARRRWSCAACGTPNSIEVDRCTACGSSMFEAFGATSASEPVAADRDPKIAAALSILPGAGHLYLGQTGQGVVRLFLAAWWLGTALVLSAAALAPIRLLFVSAWLFLVLVSVIDAYRAVGADRRPPLLSRQVIIYLSLALVALMTFGTVGLFISAR